MGTFQASLEVVRSTGCRLAAAALPLFLSVASCTGSIDQGNKPATMTVIGPDGKPMEVPVTPNPGPGPNPGPNPGPGPTGGGPGALTPFESAPSASSRFLRLSHTQRENSVRALLHIPASGVSERFVAEPRRSTF